MQRSELPTYYADNVGLIHAVARQGFLRLTRMGASYPYDDLFQELTVTFIKAFDGYNDNSGYKFSTYFTVSARHRMNAIVDKVAEERIRLNIRSVEELADKYEDMDACELAESDAPSAEQVIAANESLASFVGKLSPLAAKIVGMAIDPPDFIEREFEAASAHAKATRDNGTLRRSPGSMNVAFICNVLDRARVAPAYVVREARREIFKVAKGVFQ